MVEMIFRTLQASLSATLPTPIAVYIANLPVSLFTAYCLWFSPLGFIGIHHIYLGRWKSFLLSCFTCSLFGFKWLWDGINLKSYWMHSSRYDVQNRSVSTASMSKETAARAAANALTNESLNMPQSSHDMDYDHTTTKDSDLNRRKSSKVAHQIVPTSNERTEHGSVPVTTNGTMKKGEKSGAHSTTSRNSESNLPSFSSGSRQQQNHSTENVVDQAVKHQDIPQNDTGSASNLHSSVEVLAATAPKFLPVAMSGIPKVESHEKVEHPHTGPTHPAETELTETVPISNKSSNEKTEENASEDTEDSTNGAKESPEIKSSQQNNQHGNNRRKNKKNGRH